MNERKIIKKEINKTFIKKWMNEGLNPILVTILNRRGITTDTELLAFLYGTTEYYMDPFEYSDMLKTCIRIEKAINNNEIVLIYGDRDVDGTTSISMMKTFLESMGLKVIWDLPVGEESYGINGDKVTEWKDRQVTLCITVDCGITNNHEIELLSRAGIETIVIDHHEPPLVPPNAFSIINPKFEYSGTEKSIAACAVTFTVITGYLIYRSEFLNKKILFITKFGDYYSITILMNLRLIDRFVSIELDNSIIKGAKNGIYDEKTIKTDKEISFLSTLGFREANIEDYFAIPDIKKTPPGVEMMELSSLILARRYIVNNCNGYRDFYDRNISIAALGLIADIIPLRGISRSIVNEGLSRLHRNPSPSLRALTDHLGLSDKFISSKEASWQICPILNAPGRMGDARVTVDFLTTDEYNIDLFNKMINFNEERKIRGKEALDTFNPYIDQNIKEYNNKMVFLYGESINRGITGIAASKISNERNVPVIIAAKQGELYTGSVRGKTNISFVELLDMAEHLLVQYGGHKSAAGFTIHENNLNEFIDFLRDKSNGFNNDESHLSIDVDAEIPLQFLNNEIFKIADRLEPTGEANPTPVFLTKNIIISDPLKIGKDKNHIKFFVQSGAFRYPCLFWNSTDYFYSIYNEKGLFDIIYTLEINRFNGSIIPQLIIQNMTQCGSDA